MDSNTRVSDRFAELIIHTVRAQKEDTWPAAVCEKLKLLIDGASEAAEHEYMLGTHVPIAYGLL